MIKPAYYNERDKFAAQWLRNLIAAGHIAPGDVDERSIEDVRPDDLAGYRQCHFFAGIGVWSYALRRAGWSDDREIWTMSCPCQPFSMAGEGEGFADERHLWPHAHHLVAERRPAAILGEQVASKDAEPWLDLVCADLGSLGYASGAIAFPAAGVGAPHIRDRLYWMAHAMHVGPQGSGDTGSGEGVGQARAQLAGAGADGGLGDTDDARLEGHARHDGAKRWPGQGRSVAAAGVPSEQRRAGPTNGFWRDADWLLCRDGRWRPTRPGTFPLAHGAPARVGRLRAYGNALCAEAATVFCQVVKEIIE